MKRLVLIGVLILCVSAAFFAPVEVSARGTWHHHHSAGWFVGGLVLGTVIGSSAVPHYYYSPVYRYPRVVYSYPAPVYVYQPPVVYVAPEPPNRAYAYPDPSYVEANRGPSGEWITVPGQWVEGKWVPEHKTWVPADSRP